MSNGREFDRPMTYRIRIQGQLDETWSHWFEDLTVVLLANERTALVGTVRDQVALHGILARIRDLGLPLISVECLDPTCCQPESVSSGARD